MATLKKLYGSSMTLLTDLYQITMAYSYWKTGMAEREAVFHLFFRKKPFDGGYAIACGLDLAIDYIQNFGFDDSDLDYLKTLNGNDGKPLFDLGFIEYLKNLEFSCTIDAVPEGTPVFENEPMLRVQGPLLQAQLIETPLLNIINFQTLVATKSARVCQAAGKAPVMEFGLRRAQGFDGGMAASRAAFIGGCATTSNVLAGKLMGIPVSGTHAHSWVMSFDSESEAFEKYAAAMENNCTLLVDTYDTRQGIANAIAVGKALKARGKKLMGIRIDSGDLAYLSQLGRTMLDNAGLHDTKIILSNDIDEYILESLHDQHAKMDLLGIGTKLVTAYDQPALGGVYKLSALKNKKGEWESKIKLSEQTIKINIPGIQQVRRFYHNGLMITDMIYDIELGVHDDPTIVDPNDPTKTKSIRTEHLFSEDLLVPIFENGKKVYQSPELADIRERVFKELEKLHTGIKRFVNPHVYVVGLEQRLYEKRLRLILEQRNLIS
ncbi:MAG: nicotinate phosphoribosyltransferase [Cyclobacteriaceae bacterium]|nr:nicotinate phosphoribosyltransferase [Cyclobacteriaceae bacterium]